MKFFLSQVPCNCLISPRKKILNLNLIFQHTFTTKITTKNNCSIKKGFSPTKVPNQLQWQ
uniref:Uncharacterized protein n=1 Tax=Ciona intestinalis TaxID=7719 RepID=H2XXD8_CIOIN